jgi:hypothetical protein
MPMILIMAPGWRHKIEVAALPYLMGAADDIADDIRANLRAAGNYDTGMLYRSVSNKRTRVSIGTDHWQYIEFGTHPHIIRATRKKALANEFQVFGKVVRHPGNRAYAPIRRATYKKRRLKKGVGGTLMAGVL